MASTASAGETPPAAPDPRLGEGLAGDGRVLSGNGLALAIVQPEFRAARDLLEALAAMQVPDLAVVLVSPRVLANLRDKEAEGTETMARLLLEGTPEGVAEGRRLLAQLDRPEPSLLLCLSIAEVVVRSAKEHGSALSYDRSLGLDPKATLFRGVGLDFRPSSMLRRDLIGLSPYEGTALALGDADWLHGRLEIGLVGLLGEGRVRWLLRPHLLLTEGVPAELDVLQHWPDVLVEQHSVAATQITVREDAIGLQLRAGAVSIARDRAEVYIELNLRMPEPIDPDRDHPYAIALRDRVVRTQLTLPDRQSVVFGGLMLRGRTRSRVGLPSVPAAFDAVLGGAAFRGEDRELVCIATVAIRPAVGRDTPGTHHARLLEDERLERLQSRPRPSTP